MKFYNLILAVGLLLFAGCGFGDDEEEKDDPAQTGDELSGDEKDDQAEDIREGQAQAKAKYNPAFQLKVKNGEEELLVVHQSSKDGVQNVILAVDAKEEVSNFSNETSADLSQKRINSRLASRLKIEKNLCIGEKITVENIKALYGSLAIVSGSVKVLTGADEASGYTVAGDVKNHDNPEVPATIELSKNLAPVTFTEVAGSKTASSLALGEYADWVNKVTAVGFCAEFKKQNPTLVPAVPAAGEGETPAGSEVESPTPSEEPPAAGSSEPVVAQDDAEPPAAE